MKVRRSPWTFYHMPVETRGSNCDGTSFAFSDVLISPLFRTVCALISQLLFLFAFSCQSSDAFRVSLKNTITSVQNKFISNSLSWVCYWYLLPYCTCVLFFFFTNLSHQKSSKKAENVGLQCPKLVVEHHQSLFGLLKSRSLPCLLLLFHFFSFSWPRDREREKKNKSLGIFLDRIVLNRACFPQLRVWDIPIAPQSEQAQFLI